MRSSGTRMAESSSSRLHKEVRRGTLGSILLQARLSGAELVELLR